MKLNCSERLGEHICKLVMRKKWAICWAPFITWYPRMGWSSSICFRCACKIRFWARYLTLKLSHKSKRLEMYGHIQLRENKLKPQQLNGGIRRAFCFANFQEIKLWTKKVHKTLILFLSLSQLIQWASHKSIMSRAWMVSWENHGLKCH